MKNLLLLLLCLTAINQAFSLDCFATDLEGLKRGDLRPQVQDCKDNVRHTLEMQGLSAATIPDYIVYRCYQVNIITDAANYAVHGCIPEGACDVTKYGLQRLFDRDPTTPVQEINCYECGTSLCNSSNVKYGVGFVIAILVAFAIVM